MALGELLPLFPLPVWRLFALSVPTSTLRLLSLSVRTLYISCVPFPMTLKRVERSKSTKLPSRNSYTKLLLTWMVRVPFSNLSGFISANQVVKVASETLSRIISRHLFHLVLSIEFIGLFFVNGLSSYAEHKKEACRQTLFSTISYANIIN